MEQDKENKIRYLDCRIYINYKGHITCLCFEVVCQNVWILLDNRRGIDLRMNNNVRNSNGKMGNGTSMSSRQMGTWPQLIGCALFKIWSLILDCELKSRRGYSTGRLEVCEILLENQKWYRDFLNT